MINNPVIFDDNYWVNLAALWTYLTPPLKTQVHLESEDWQVVNGWTCRRRSTERLNKKGLSIAPRPLMSKKLLRLSRQIQNSCASLRRGNRVRTVPLCSIPTVPKQFRTVLLLLDCSLFFFLSLFWKDVWDMFCGPQPTVSESFLRRTISSTGFYRWLFVFHPLCL